MQISTVTQILKRHTLTQERAHSKTSHRPLLGPFLETWSVRLQLIPKVRGGCENVSTVYPGAFWRLYCSCSLCDLDTVTSCERVYCVSTARRGLAPRCEISVCVVNSAPRAEWKRFLFFYSASSALLWTSDFTICISETDFSHPFWDKCDIQETKFSWRQKGLYYVFLFKKI